MIRKLKFLRAGAFAFACLSATAARAVIVTVNSVQYDVSTVTGNYASLASTLQSQVWWGNESVADSFAAAVGGHFGFPNSSLGGPFFAFATSGSDVVARAWQFGGSTLGILVLGPASRTFAVAHQVGSVPDSGITSAMLCLALGALIALRRRLA